MVEYNEEIKQLEAELAKTKYNKATQHHVGLVKAKIAKLKEKQESRSSKKGKTTGYDVRKTGDGTVILVGYPSVGKSTLLNHITDAKSKTGAYAFTTLTVVPGTLNFNHAKIQILDVPGIVKGASDGTGRGKEVLSVARSADLIILLIEVHYPEHHDVLIKELYNRGIRLNQKRPDVTITKTIKDGIHVASLVKLTKIDADTIKGIMREFKMINADVVLREDINIDQFIDCLEDNKQYVPCLTVVNKIDMVSKEKASEIMKKVKGDLAVSAEKSINIEKLKEMIFYKLNLIRIYMKEPGKEADLNVPLIIFKNSSVKDVCNKLHKDFVAKFKFCRIWGKSSKFPGQKLQLNHILKDGDVLEIHLR
ncbi:GTP-binding protein [Candidatus Woesearchaeota archaeon]|nr:MAG: GTP-binding protein [Candidatus Woesearchaeota archaeon]